MCVTLWFSVCWFAAAGIGDGDVLGLARPMVDDHHPWMLSTSVRGGWQICTLGWGGLEVGFVIWALVLVVHSLRRSYPPIAGGVNMLGGAGRIVLVRRCSVVEMRYSACPFGFYPFTDTLLVCAASRKLLVRRRSAMLCETRQNPFASECVRVPFPTPSWLPIWICAWRPPFFGSPCLGPKRLADESSVRGSRVLVSILEEALSVVSSPVRMVKPESETKVGCQICVNWLHARMDLGRTLFAPGTQWRRSIGKSVVFFHFCW